MPQTKLTAVVVDDMELARASLKADIDDHCPNVEVIGEAESVLGAAKLLKEVSPDIIFLDIEMGDGNGFDLLDIVPTVGSQIIFVTARQEYALKAFQYAALDYLLKPVDPALLKKSVDKIAQKKTDHLAQLDLLKASLSESTNKLEKIALHTSDKIEIVALDNIVRIEAMTNYSTFHLEGGKKILITKTLKEYDKMLSDSGFIRVHQSHLVNKDHIKAYIKTEGGYLLMKDDSNVPVSVRKKAYVVNLLGQ